MYYLDQIQFATFLKTYYQLLESAELTVEQVSKGKTLYLAKFDDEILEQIKTNLPELVDS